MTNASSNRPEPKEPGVIRWRGGYLLRLPYWPPLNQQLRLIGQWDPGERAWIIPETESAELDEILAQYGLGRFEVIDELWLEIAKLKSEAQQSVRSGSSQDPFRQLFSAIPPELKTNAYRALARVLHPDTGGDDRVMKALNRAYDDARPR